MKAQIERMVYPLHYLEMKEDYPEINPDLCLGCGLCVTGCPEEALKLVRREDLRQPAPKGRDIGMAILKDRGRLKEI